MTSTEQRKPNSLISILVGLCVVAIVIFIVMVFMIAFAWHQGGISAWPSEIEAIYEKLPEELKSQISGVKVFGVDDFIDMQYIWRLNCPHKVYDEFRNHLQMRTISKDDVPQEFWHMPPAWWNPDSNSKSEFARSLGNPSTDPRLDGINLIIMYDEKNRTLYGWYYEHF